MHCKFCEEKIEVAAWAASDGGHRCRSGERHEPFVDSMRQHWIDKLRVGAASIDKLVQGGSWPKHAHEAVLARIFDTDANNLRYLADMLEAPPVGKAGIPCKDCQGDGYREGSGYPCATCNATGEVLP